MSKMPLSFHNLVDLDLARCNHSNIYLHLHTFLLSWSHQEIPQYMGHAAASYETKILMQDNIELTVSSQVLGHIDIKSMMFYARKTIIYCTGSYTE